MTVEYEQDRIARVLKRIREALERLSAPPPEDKSAPGKRRVWTL